MAESLNINVLIRVYNRLSDLQVCLETIRNNWNLNNYHIIIVSSGASEGFAIPESIKILANQVIEISSNSGLLGGNRALLMKGIESISTENPITVILEADTWIFSDKIIQKYSKILINSDSVWASAEWIEKYYSLALDFAIIKTAFLKSDYQIFTFTKHAESYVYNYLTRNQKKYIHIKEAMPVHQPSRLRSLLHLYGGRVRGFSRVPMVTHHIEDIKTGLTGKMRAANIVCGKLVFEKAGPKFPAISNRFYKLYEFLVRFFPRSTWIRRKKVRTC